MTIFPICLQGSTISVSYTHLDVYKRQVVWSSKKCSLAIFLLIFTASGSAAAVSNASRKFFCKERSIKMCIRDSRLSVEGVYINVLMSRYDNILTRERL